jgi:hypothetical protein
MRRRWDVGIADAQADEVNPLAPHLIFDLIDFRK